MRIALALLGLAASAAAQVTYERLLNAVRDPANWITYSGTYGSQRHSRLEQIRAENAHRLKLRWVHQLRTLEKVETTPLVADGVMYVSRPPSDVVALDAETGRPYWTYARVYPEKVNVCCGQVNRGVALLGDAVFVGTVDAHLVALNRKTGSVLWDVEVADLKRGYSVTVAPLVVKDKVITGIAGGEYGIRGFIDAYDARTGKRAWRFYTIPGPGEPGSETWSGDSWKTGGGSTWVTGSYDPELNLIYWGVGNPSPDWNGDVRPGDNLYSDSVVALDADSGKLKWHFQFTPHDLHDWDAVQVPVLADEEWRGRKRKLMYWGNRNGFFYALDRSNGEFLLAKPFVKVTWAERIDEKGRPVRIPDTGPSREGRLVWPGVQGGTNWYSPSYSPVTKLFYMSVWDYASIFYIGDSLYSPGNRFLGSLPVGVPEDPGKGYVKALDPQSGEVKWEYGLESKPQTGLLSTAGNLLFGGTDEGHFFALDARTGRELWRVNTGGVIAAGVVSYLSRGRQQVSVAAGNSIFTFALE